MVGSVLGGHGTASMMTVAPAVLTPRNLAVFALASAARSTTQRLVLIAHRRLNATISVAPTVYCSTGVVD